MNIALIFLASLITFIWAILAIRSIALALRSRRLTEVDAWQGDETELPLVQAIVPAHNEETHIEQIVGHILRQNWPLEKLQLLVVNDQSTDKTAQILQQLLKNKEFSERLSVLNSPDRPPGWAGKTWAVHQGLLAANPEATWLWLVDSDMSLSPLALKVAYAEASRTSADFISLTAGIDFTSKPQRSTALAMIHLLWQIYPLPHVNNRNRAEALAHGAFILTKQSTLDSIGGMEPLKHEIIEDIRLAQKVKASGVTLSVRAAPQISRTHFYGSIKDILNGLRKNAYAGMDYMPHKFWTGLVLGLLLTWLPAAMTMISFVKILISGSSITNTIGFTIGLFGWLLQAQSLLPIVQYLDLPKFYCFSLPIGGSIYIYACCLSYWDYIRGRITWRGRHFNVNQLHEKSN